MKELLLQYANYNVWANKQLLHVCSSLEAEKIIQEVDSSFKSLYATFLHLWDAEVIWWQRVKMQEQLVIPSLSFNPTMQEISAGLLEQGQTWIDWISKSNELMMNHEFVYRNSKKEQFKQPIWQVLIHLFNHGTFHRGQVITMMRHLGVTTLPATDFIHWTRRKS